MHVPADIKARIVEILKAGIAKAEARYKMTFPFPRVTYNQGGGSIAGTANYRTWTIDLNPGILMQNVEEFLGDTVLHELGHLICDKVYPEAHLPGAGGAASYSYRTGRYKRAKREVHGPRWVECTYACGHPNPLRCHTMNTEGLKKGAANRFRYECTCGKQGFDLSAKKHKALQLNPDAVWHRGCKGVHKLVLKGTPQAPTIIKRDVPTGVTTVRKIADPFANVTVVKSADQQGSKLDQCWAIYKRNVGSSRGAIIQTMVTVANCTPAGAATYYATCKKRYEAGVL